jgi:hypothetical protein
MRGILTFGALAFVFLLAADGRADEREEALIRELLKVRSAFQTGLMQCADNAARLPPSFKPTVTDRIKGGDAPVSLRADITGLEHLCLVAEGDMGGGHTYWGEPVLIDAAGQATRLTDLQPQVLVVVWSELHVNKGNGPFCSVGKQRMAFGLFAHVDSYLSYALDKKYVRFEAKVGNRGQRLGERPRPLQRAGRL